jgi:multiple sugar transport system substrate-binding protein
MLHTHRPTRRELLRWFGAGSMGAMGLYLAGCAQPTPTPAPTSAPAEGATQAPATSAPTAAPPTPAPLQGNVVAMVAEGELTEEVIAPLKERYPGIEIELVGADATRFFAMYAAGNPPDILRTQAPAIPQYLARKMLLDLTPYFETSAALHLDDLAPANDYYKANSPVDIGQGKIYGMCKDWSPDFTIFAYKPAFEKAGVQVPDDTTPLTYEQIFELARDLTQREGDRTLTWGYGYGDWWMDRIWMNMLAELNSGLYDAEFAKISLSGNDEAKKVLKYYFDLAKENLVANPLNPSPSWNGEDFTKGTLAMLQYGYWYSASAESDVTAGGVIMLPAPTWAGVRRDPTITATGYILTAATKVADIAWKVFEFYMGEEPALDRAKSGWGVPALKSMYDLMPSETPYQQQVQRVLQAELNLATSPLRFNPFLGESTTADSWAKHLDMALRDQITFDDLLRNMEAEVNVAIQEGIDRLG